MEFLFRTNLSIKIVYRDICRRKEKERKEKKKCQSFKTKNLNSHAVEIHEVLFKAFKSLPIMP